MNPARRRMLRLSANLGPRVLPDLLAPAVAVTGSGRDWRTVRGKGEILGNYTTQAAAIEARDALRVEYMAWLCFVLAEVPA